MSTTYASITTARDAQTALDQHLVYDLAGRCAACREPEPCAGRMVAAAAFRKLGALPQRVPGRAGVVLLGRR
jgi:hypothetical protein